MRAAVRSIPYKLFYLTALICLISPAYSQEQPDILPAEEGELKALLRENGRAQLENEFLRCVFDPEDEGAASSIFYKPTEKEMAVSLTYGERHFKAFRERVGRPWHGGRWPSPEGQSYELIRLAVEDNAAVARFTGYPEVVAETEGPNAPYGNVRIIKTYTLRRGEPRIDVEVRAVNENEQTLPLPMWIAAGGLRIDGEDAYVFAPGPNGTISRREPWVKGGSNSLIIPRASAAWNAAISEEPPRVGFYVAGRDDQIESIDNFLIKFNGFQFGMGVAMHDVPAGEELVIPYSFVATRDFTRIDSASPELACGISLDINEDDLEPGDEAEAAVELVAPSSADIEFEFSVTRLPSDTPFFVSQGVLELEAGVGASEIFRIAFEDEGLYVLACEARTPGGETLRAERPVRVGLTTERYAAQMPERTGRSRWPIALGERPLPEWMRTVDREVRHPMVPWNNPAAEPFRILFVGEPDWTIGMIRDIARRTGGEWDVINLHWPHGMTSYRKTEQEMFADKMDEFDPDVVLTAGIRYSGVEMEFINRLLAGVEGGMGLVIVGDQPGELAGPWPAILERDDFVELDAPHIGGGMDAITAQRIIAGRRPGPANSYGYGEGRIVTLRRPSVGLRNQLTPRHMGRTELPDWEYYFMEYIRAMRFAADSETDSRIEGASIDDDAISVRLDSDAPREVTLVCDMASTDLADMRHIAFPAELEEGAGVVRIPISRPLGSEYILHLWIIEGAGKEQTVYGRPGDKSIIMRDHPFGRDYATLDFDARFTTYAPRITIDDLRIHDERASVPIGVSFEPKGEPVNPDAELIARLRIYNGDDSRLVWRVESDFTPGQRLMFRDFNYQPVSPNNVAIIELFEGDEKISALRRPFRARTLNNIAENDIAYYTVSGHIENWYVTEMMKDWTREAEVEIVPFPYGGDLHWRRERDNKMNPPIVDETSVREDYARSLQRHWDNGVAWLCLDDELRIGGEYDFSEPTLEVFRDRLRGMYGDIANLNEEWGADFASFDEVRPALLSEARENPDRPGAWLDFRLFIDEIINRRYEIAREIAEEISPLMRVGPSGMYAPSYTTGVNYYLMCGASPLIKTYPGIRADWAQAFMPEDGRIGVWRGYGGQHPAHVWEFAIRGFDLIGWWGYITSGRLAHMSMVDVNIKPARNFDAVAEQQRELKAGLGKLLLDSRRAEPRVMIPYSQSSAYIANLLERNYSDASTAVRDMLQSLNILYTFVADEQAQAGRLDNMNNSVFILPGIDAMPENAARAYADSVDRGSFALADAEAAWRNGHGALLTESPLDPVFGIDRANAKAAGSPTIEAINWTEDAPERLRAAPGEMPRALHNVAVNENEATKIWARFDDGTPAIVAARSQADSLAVWMNTRFEWSPRTDIRRAERPEDEPDRLAPLKTVENITRHLLAQAEVEPPINITPRDQAPSLVGHFVNGRSGYFGAQIHGLGETREVTVTLAGEGHIYDAREGRYIGEDSEFSDVFDPASLAKIYARLPYRVSGVDATLNNQVVEAGGRVIISGSLVAEDADANEYHVVRCQVITPDGERPRYYRRNLEAQGGRFSVRIPIALNAPQGEWRVELRDVATGTTETVTFEVR